MALVLHGGDGGYLGPDPVIAAHPPYTDWLPPWTGPTRHYVPNEGESWGCQWRRPLNYPLYSSLDAATFHAFVASFNYKQSP